MRNRLFAVFALAIAAGGGLAFATYRMQGGQSAAPAAMPTQPIVIAAADLQLGTELKAEDLKVINFPKGQAPQGAFAAPSDILGRGVISAIVKGEPVLPGKLASKEAGFGLPTVIPEGMRAISVRVNEVIGVAGYVLPGTHVDVVATASPGNQQGDMTSKVVLSNVQVLTAGTRMEQDQEQGKPVAVTVVTLLVKPEQAERVALASTEGKIQLALRNPLDRGAPETPGIKPAVLMGANKPLVRPAAPRRVTAPTTMTPAAPAPPPTVEVIRGDKRATEIIR